MFKWLYLLVNHCFSLSNACFLTQHRDWIGNLIWYGNTGVHVNADQTDNHMEGLNDRKVCGLPADKSWHSRKLNLRPEVVEPEPPCIQASIDSTLGNMGHYCKQVRLIKCSPAGVDYVQCTVCILKTHFPEVYNIKIKRSLCSLV